ncbi:hypothetical protein P171DRAFT_506509 [Karstenula rhodostoma CBS 690.94]|uniref:Uncharacterized protein n=1 Tax=Karstenula rhodostoma CBS 690.94 TaxID=1392251 RepID=A0A9P4P4D7_9PLEO|nr:hypothetical protein P171DRAFT_506509 [Karstenula rhodostoma CBS 690.94]
MGTTLNVTATTDFACAPVRLIEEIFISFTFVNRCLNWEPKHRGAMKKRSGLRRLHARKRPDSALLRKRNYLKFHMPTVSLSPFRDIELVASKMPLRTSVAQSYSFAQGWGKLPDELRLAILIAVFAHDHAIDRAEYDKILDQLYLPLLLTPYAGIATEAFFAHNAFYIPLALKCYPPPSQNTWIHWIEIDLTDDEAFPCWTFLTRLCTGVLGFERLREIDLTLTSNIKNGDTRGSRFASLIDLGLSPEDLTLILSSVKKLSLTRNILFKDTIHCSIWYGTVPRESRRAHLWNKILLQGEYVEEYPLPMGFIDLDGQLYTYHQLPFEEVDHPALGFSCKQGMLQGFKQVRTLTRKHTSSRSRITQERSRLHISKR